MRTEIKELHQRLKTTSIYVTHDQIEAMTMADQIVVMHDGSIEQIGSPLRALRPAGEPLRRRLHRLAGDELHRRHAATAASSTAANGGTAAGAAGAARASGRRRPVVYGIRPEHLDIADDGFEAEVVVVEPTGSETQVFARLGTQDSWSACSANGTTSRPGQQDPAACRAPSACTSSTRRTANGSSAVPACPPRRSDQTRRQR